jgi:ubiquinone/menaquinone biosynthesis C-methylase UbiE
VQDELLPGGDQAHERWLAKQAHYQDERVVAQYDEQRFRGWRARGSTVRKWNPIWRELGPELPRGSVVLDVPCGRGRFTENILGSGLKLVDADLSRPMLERALERAGDDRRVRGAVQCSATCLPFQDASFDLVMSIRFLFHVPRAMRADILREMARVSKRFVVVDVRHRYCWTTHTKRLRAWIVRRRPPSERATIAELDQLVADAGLKLRRRIWLAPLLSEKMLLVCEKR